MFDVLRRRNGRVSRSELLPRIWPMYRVALPWHFAEELTSAEHDTIPWAANTSQATCRSSDDTNRKARPFKAPPHAP
jgi:hypothetical protein